MEVKQPGSHFDHLLRQTRMHHMQLSSMADVKANILLTMASVVITLSLRYISDPVLRWTAIVLMTFCLATIVLATYAVMPHLPFTIRKRKSQDVDLPRFNILFFGDFAGMAYEDYERAFEKLLNDPSEAYRAQVKEVYQLGVFLASKKYRFVRLAYLSFIIGFLSSGGVLLTNELLRTQ